MAEMSKFSIFNNAEFALWHIWDFHRKNKFNYNINSMWLTVHSSISIKKNYGYLVKGGRKWEMSMGPHFLG